MKKNGKYCSSKKGLNMKPLALLLALTLLVGCVVGGTIAWLTAQTPEVKNTFTVGDIRIDLKEHKLEVNETTGEYELDREEEVNANSDYMFVPGDTLPKDPFVKVLGGEVDCEAHYLFIKIEVANNNISVGQNTEAIVNFAVEDGWTYYGKVNGENIEKDSAPQKYLNGTYYFYKNNAKTTTDVTYDILVNDQVTISTEVTKDMHGTLSDSATKPVVSFWAAAVQSENLPAPVAPKTAEDVAFGLITWPAAT